jgi:hypothetical protein
MVVGKKLFRKSKEKHILEGAGVSSWPQILASFVGAPRELLLLFLIFLATINDSFGHAITGRTTRYVQHK